MTLRARLQPARIVLADGTVFRGAAFGAEAEAVGEALGGAGDELDHTTFGGGAAPAQAMRSW